MVTALHGEDFCHYHRDMSPVPLVYKPTEVGQGEPPVASTEKPQTMVEKYPQYYKSVRHLTEVDVYAICYLFKIEDHSGCIHHSIKKLLLSGTRNGGKSRIQDIQEARNQLNRYLELHGIE
jgi:hypothetical protein